MLFAPSAAGVIPYYGIEGLPLIDEDAIGYPNETWRDCNIPWLSFLYLLLIDTPLFIPIYGMFFPPLGRQNHSLRW